MGSIFALMGEFFVVLESAFIALLPEIAITVVASTVAIAGSTLVTEMMPSFEKAKKVTKTIFTSTGLALGLAHSAPTSPANELDDLIRRKTHEVVNKVLDDLQATQGPMSKKIGDCYKKAAARTLTNVIHPPYLNADFTNRSRIVTEDDLRIYTQWLEINRAPCTLVEDKNATTEEIQNARVFGDGLMGDVVMNQYNALVLSMHSHGPQ